MAGPATSLGVLSAAQVSASPAPTEAIGAEGTDGQLWAQAPQLGSGWHPLGGVITAPPAVAAPTNADAANQPLFIATGTDQGLWIRSVTVDWQPVGAARCIGAPAAVITGSILTVACRGTDNALWYVTTTLPPSGLPAFTGTWTNLGGVLSAGPAEAVVNNVMTFFVRGSSGAIFTRTVATGYSQTSWDCIGSPAAAQQWVDGLTTFACQGTDHALWEATSTGLSWSSAVSQGGTLVGGPAVAAAGLDTGLLAEGTDHAVWQRTPAGWTSLGGDVVGGIGAVALNMPGGTPWGNAIEVPGTAALDTGLDAQTVSVSCPSAGNCTAGGFYTVGFHNQQAFVADEVNGTWRNATEVPGATALNVGLNAQVTSVSCPSAGNCAAVGYYGDSSTTASTQAFAADEVNGTRGNASEIPGTAALNTGDSAAATSVSCPSAGNCAAVGYYGDGGNGGNGAQAFVAIEVNGSWDSATEIPGTAALNTGDFAHVASVSCPSPGDCAAGGWYEVPLGNGSYASEAFVVSEVSGSWGNAVEVPGTAALNTDGYAQVSSVSCASAGNCAVGGWYDNGSLTKPGVQAFVVSQVNGIWGEAIQVPGMAALNTSGGAEVTSVSCTSAGNCGAGGFYGDSSSSQAFVVSEVNGTWGEAIQVPGTAIVGSGRGAHLSSVSCSSAGNCVAGGNYNVDYFSLTYVSFLVTEVNGTWGEAFQVPGTPSVSSPTEVGSVSCPPVGGCAAGGAYTDVSNNTHAFVVSEN